MLTASYISPAKVNLFLRVTEKRSDGYHNIASLFQTISLADTLVFALDIPSRDYTYLTCSRRDIPTNDSNLILKAARLFRENTELPFNLKVYLEKHIPVQAGLGGGSSNAATTLWALNEMSKRPLTYEQLLAIAAQIGADVPFFLSQGTAYCTGIGDVIRPLTPLPNRQLHLFKPAEGLSTPEVYAHLRLDKLKQHDPEESLSSFMNGGYDFFNDMEQSAFSLKPSLITFKKNLLSSGYKNALMSGSGSCFFCLGDGKLAPSEDVWTHSAHFVNRPADSWYAE